MQLGTYTPDEAGFSNFMEDVDEETEILLGAREIFLLKKGFQENVSIILEEVKLEAQEGLFVAHVGLNEPERVAVNFGERAFQVISKNSRNQNTVIRNPNGDFTVNINEKIIRLTPFEALIMNCFLKKPNQIIGKDALEFATRGNEQRFVMSKSNLIEVKISKLRKKLGNENSIITHKNQGFSWAIEENSSLNISPELAINTENGVLFFEGRKAETLGEKELTVFKCIYELEGNLCSIETLIEAIFSAFQNRPKDPIQVIQIYISRIRKKLEALSPGAGQCIETVVGEGYRFRYLTPPPISEPHSEHSPTTPGEYKSS